MKDTSVVVLGDREDLLITKKTSEITTRVLCVGLKLHETVVSWYSSNNNYYIARGMRAWEVNQVLRDRVLPLEVKALQEKQNISANNSFNPMNEEYKHYINICLATNPESVKGARYYDKLKCHIDMLNTKYGPDVCINEIDVCKTFSDIEGVYMNCLSPYNEPQLDYQNCMTAGDFFKLTEITDF